MANYPKMEQCRDLAARYPEMPCSKLCDDIRSLEKRGFVSCSSEVRTTYFWELCKPVVIGSLRLLTDQINDTIPVSQVIENKTEGLPKRKALTNAELQKNLFVWGSNEADFRTLTRNESLRSPEQITPLVAAQISRAIDCFLDQYLPNTDEQHRLFTDVFPDTEFPWQPEGGRFLWRFLDLSDHLTGGLVGSGNDLRRRERFGIDLSVAIKTGHWLNEIRDRKAWASVADSTAHLGPTPKGRATKIDLEASTRIETETSKRWEQLRAVEREEIEVLSLMHRRTVQQASALENDEDLRVGVGDQSSKTSILESTRSERDRLESELQALRNESENVDIFASEENRELWGYQDGQLVYRKGNGKERNANPGDFLHLSDPIDGTIPYLKHLFFAVAIAVSQFQDGSLFWFGGVIMLPKTDELFLGWVGGGAILIDLKRGIAQKITTSQEKDVRKSQIGVQLSGQERNAHLIDPFIKSVLPNLKDASARLHHWGCGAMSLAYTAAGFIEGFLSPKSGGSWDHMAGKIIVEAAGGKITDIHAKEFTEESKSIAAICNEEMYSAIWHAALRNYRETSD